MHCINNYYYIGSSSYLIFFLYVPSYKIAWQKVILFLQNFCVKNKHNTFHNVLKFWRSWNLYIQDQSQAFNLLDINKKQHIKILLVVFEYDFL